MNLTGEQILNDYLPLLLDQLEKLRITLKTQEHYEVSVKDIQQLTNNKYQFRFIVRRPKQGNDNILKHTFDAVFYKLPYSFAIQWDFNNTVMKAIESHLTEITVRFETIYDIKHYTDQITNDIQLFRFVLSILGDLMKANREIENQLNDNPYTIYDKIQEFINNPLISGTANDKRLALIMAYHLTYPNNFGVYGRIIADAIATNDLRTIDHLRSIWYHDFGSGEASYYNIIYDDRIINDVINILLTEYENLPFLADINKCPIMDDTFTQQDPIYQRVIAKYRSMNYEINDDSYQPIMVEIYMPTNVYKDLHPNIHEDEYNPYDSSRPSNREFLVPKVDSYLKLKAFFDSDLVMQLDPNMIKIELGKYFPTLDELSSWSKIAGAFYQAMDLYQEENWELGYINGSEYGRLEITDNYHEFMSEHPLSRLALAMAYSWIYPTPKSLLNYLRILINYDDVNAIKFMMARIRDVVMQDLSVFIDEINDDISLYLKTHGLL